MPLAWLVRQRSNPREVRVSAKRLFEPAYSPLASAHCFQSAKSVVDAYAERARLSVHPLTGRFARVRTLLAWRRDMPQAKLAALEDMLDAATRGQALTPARKSTQRRER